MQQPFQVAIPNPIYISWELVKLLELMECIPDLKTFQCSVPHKRLQRIFRGTSFASLSEYLAIKAAIMQQNLPWQPNPERSKDIVGMMNSCGMIVTTQPTQEVDGANWKVLRELKADVAHLIMRFISIRTNTPFPSYLE